jgi:hypothetical protein
MRVARPNRSLAAAALAVVALGVPGVASAHGTTAYVATVRGIVPPLPGVDVRVARGFQVVLTSRRRDAVVVVGPNGAPSWRFTRAGVAANLGGGARPDWVVVTPKHTFAWPDARTAKPAVAPLTVRRAPGKSHHVADWRIPLRAGGRSYAVVGTLDYRASAGGLAELLFPLAPMPLLLLFGVGILRRARG